VEKKISTNGCFWQHFYLRSNKTLIHNSLCCIWHLGETFKP